jgi:hypothetical protein
MTPYEVVVGPYTVWVAPVGTAFPVTNANPSGSWIKLGTNGTKNYDEKGVTVTHTQNLQRWKPVGSTGNRKVWRDSEVSTIEFELVDATLEQIALVLNNASVSTQVGPPATKTISLQQGQNVAVYALLARGNSPYNDSLNAQYQVPIAFQAANPAPNFGLSGPAGFACTWEFLEDPTSGFGTLVAQTS